jgi:hypothetical protein
MSKDTPLILVFYLDREMMSNKDIIVPFSESVDRLLVQRNINAIAFFLPAGEGESERIDCINPVYIQDDQKEKVDKILSDLKINFDIDQGADKDIDNPENEIDL